MKSFPLHRQLFFLIFVVGVWMQFPTPLLAQFVTPTPAYLVPGAQSGDALGTQVLANQIDLNGDGKKEIVTSGFGLPNFTGVVEVLDGATGNRLRSFRGASGERLGTTFTTTGPFLIAESGNGQTLPMGFKIFNLTNGNLIRSVIPTSNVEIYQVLGLGGDYNADGVAEVFVQRMHNQNQTREVLVYDVPNNTFVRTFALAYPGNSSPAQCDVNGNGFLDFFTTHQVFQAGSVTTTLDIRDGNTATVIRTYSVTGVNQIFSGFCLSDQNQDGQSEYALALSDGSITEVAGHNTLAILDGQTGGLRFAYSIPHFPKVQALEDVDGDGVGEILAGFVNQNLPIFHPQGQHSFAGIAYLFSGRTGALLQRFMLPLSVGGNAVVALASGFSSAGDLNNDNQIDIALGANGSPGLTPSPLGALLTIPLPQTFNPTPAMDYGRGFAGSHGQEPHLQVSGALRSGTTAVFQMTQGLPNAQVLLGLSPNISPSGPVFLAGGGMVLPDLSQLTLIPLQLDSAGATQITLSGGGGPFEVWAQAFTFDPASANGYNLSNAIKVFWQP